ncbi:MAG: hypothetical protein ACAH11_07855 [Sphingomonas sp.]|nr:hypothetical protein [Sphingomonas sp.]
MSETREAGRERAELAGLAAVGAAGLTPGIGNLVWLLGRDHYLEGGSIVASVMVTGMALAIAIPHLLLAVPLYRVLRRRGWVNWGTAALSGAAIGGLPLVLFTLIVGSSTHGDMQFAILWFALSGLVGGLTFRAARGRVT